MYFSVTGTLPSPKTNDASCYALSPPLETLSELGKILITKRSITCIKQLFCFYSRFTQGVSLVLSFCCLSSSRSWGQQSEMGYPKVSLPSHFNQLLRGDTKTFPAERYIDSSMSLVCSRVSSWMGMLKPGPFRDVQEAS